ncbi:UxaA family hydrolase [Thermaurantiacus sp.]
MRLSAEDNVLVALRDLAAGETHAGVTLREAVALGHKVAARTIGKGEAVVKLGARIGTATADIAAGAHVHSHNLASDWLPPEGLALGLSGEAS